MESLEPISCWATIWRPTADGTFSTSAHAAERAVVGRFDVPAVRQRREGEVREFTRDAGMSWSRASKSS